MTRPLFLITARGGSKGVPGKNLRLLGGKPLIAHTVAHALSVAGDPYDVVVTTDSPEIAEAAAEAGARVPFMRPAALASDTASSRDVMINAIDTLREQGDDYNCIVLLQPTSPFRNPEDIKKAIELFGSEKPDMVASVIPAATNPYYNAYECNEDGSLKLSKGDGSVTRRQDAPAVWEFDGAIYVISPSSLKKYPSLAAMPRILPLPSTAKYHLDIDSKIDFLIAETLFKHADL